MNQTSHTIVYFLIALILSPLAVVGQNLSVQVTNQARPTCAASNNGQITVEVTGGQAPYLYSRNGGDSFTDSPDAEFTFDNLVSGNYVILVRDANGGRGSVAHLLEAPPNLSVTLDVTDISSCDQADGAIQVNAEGGTPAYTYSGPDGDTDLHENLGAGAYNISVTDANNCLVFRRVILRDPLNLSLDSVTITPPSHCNAPDGEIEVIEPVNGNAPFEYSLDDNVYQPSNLFTGLAPGNYTVYARDANGCTGQTNIMIEAENLPQIDEITLLARPTCDGIDDGELEVAASGGDEPYEYRFFNGPWQAGNILNTAAVGMNSVQVRDANGCEAGRLFEIAAENTVDISAEVLQYDECPTDGNGDNVIEITAENGQEPYEYRLGFQQAYDADNTLEAPYGSQTIFVREANGCVSSIQFLVEAGGDAFRLENVETTLASCGEGEDGAVEFSVAGGATPYFYELGQEGGQTGALFDGLASDTYGYIITDGNNCELTGQVFLNSDIEINTEVVRQPLCENSIGGVVEVTASGGGSGDYEFSTDNGANWQSGPEVDGFSSNTSLLVRRVDDDSVTCQGRFTVEVAVLDFEIEVITQQPQCNGEKASVEFITTPNVNDRLIYNMIANGAAQTQPGLFENIGEGEVFWNLQSQDGACRFSIAEDSSFVVEPIFERQVEVKHPSNCGAENGEITVRVYGPGPFEYKLNDGPYQAENTFADLSNGQYTITARSADGCEETFSTILQSEGDVALNISALNATAADAADGSITVAVTGENAEPPFQFYFNGETFQGNQTMFVRDENITPGAYRVRVTDANGCVSEAFANVGVDEGESGFKVRGRVFLDENNNGSYDAGEPGLGNVPVFALKEFELVGYSATNPAGVYTISLPANSGQYGIEAGDKAYHAVTSPQNGVYVVSSNAEGNLRDNFDFAMTRTPGSENARDMAVSITPTGRFRPGEEIMVHLNRWNRGLVATDGETRYTTPAGADHQDADPPADNQNGAVYEWSYTGSQPGAFENIRINSELAANLDAGDVLTFDASITPDGGDDNTNNDNAFEKLLVLDSYDPNTKWVRTAESDPHKDEELKAEEDEQLTYTIYFQNEGNDDALFVRIVDILDLNHDINTFEVVGASHPVRYTIENKAAAGPGSDLQPVVHFMFEDINLPPRSEDETGSIGFVKFNIYMKGDRDCDLQVNNEVDIYFDYNPPVRTNATNLLINPSPEAENLTITPRNGLAEGDSVTFAADTLLFTETAEWDFGDDSRLAPQTGDGPFSTYYTDPGAKTFNLTLTSRFDCETVYEETLNIAPDCPPVDEVEIFSNPENEVYESQEITFRAENEGRFPEETYEWLIPNVGRPQGLGPHTVVFGDGNDGPNQNIVFRVTSPACDYEVSLFIDVLPCPDSDFPVDTVTSCESDVIEFVAPIADSVTYVWYNEDTDLQSYGRVLRSDNPGKHRVDMVNPETKCMQTAEFWNETTNCDIVVPSVFTPNGDGVNDEWQVEANNIKNFRVVIHNRYGQPVFETTNVLEGWDGSGNGGSEVPEGVYFYMLDITSFDGSNIKRTGNITVLR